MKKLNIKEKIKKFVEDYKAETDLIQSTNRKTPLHRKVSQFISILLIVVWLIAWLCSIPSSAADEPSEPIQKYISGEWIFNETPDLPSTYLSERNLSFTVPTLVNESTTVFNILTLSPDSISVGTGQTLDSALYSSHSWNSGYDRKIYFDGIQLVSDAFYSAFTSVAKPIISNLTGYTVSVPANWVSSAAYGYYDIEGSFEGSGIIASLSSYNSMAASIGIGLTELHAHVPNSVIFYLPSYDGWFSVGSSSSFTLSITGGSDVSNSELIQWFVDNNATFTLTESPEDPPTSTIIEYGAYFLEPETFNTPDVYIPLNFTDLDGNVYTGITFLTVPYDLYHSSREVIYHSEDSSDVIYSDPNNNIGSDDELKQYGRMIWVLEDTSVTQSQYDAFFDAYHYESNYDLFDFETTCLGYRLGYLDGYNLNYDEIYNSGFDAGFDDGYNRGISSQLEDSFLGDFFGGVFDALDNITLFGNISILDVAQGAIGIMILLYFLKLIAGG